MSKDHEIRKAVIQGQIEIIMGYYNKILMNKWPVDEILDTLEMDKEFLQEEQNILDAKLIINEILPIPVTGESEAIGFAEWATKEYTTVKFNGQFRWCTYEVSDFGSAKDSDYMTTDELYNLYKQSKK